MLSRFLPSEFETDPATTTNAMEPGRVTFDDKMVVRKAIQDAGIPYTYVSANCFAAYFLGDLCQPGKIFPSRDHVVLLGDGNPKAIYVDEDDIAKYTIRTIDDPRTLNKTLYLRPLENILSQREVVQIWEKLIEKEHQKSSLSKDDFLALMKGCLTNFEIGAEGEEASKLYPQIKYTKVDEYLKRLGQDYADQVGLTRYYHVCYEGCLTNFEIGAEERRPLSFIPKSNTQKWMNTSNDISKMREFLSILQFN
ncbi:unnamed protein product [Camellia sinensis]